MNKKPITLSMYRNYANLNLGTGSIGPIIVPLFGDIK